MILVEILFTIITWPLESPIVKTLVIGASTLEQLTEILRALTIKPDEEEIMKLNEIWPGSSVESPVLLAS